MPTGLSSQELTKMELDTRRQVLYYVEAFRRYLKGMEQCELTMIGPSIGFRETRRIKGKSMIKAEDVLNRKKCEDGVARGGWKPEIHKDTDKMATYMDVKEESWFDIPLGALQSDNIGNLYAAGRMISADEAAFAVVRVMGTCFATGHSAGVVVSRCTGRIRRSRYKKDQSRTGQTGSFIREDILVCRSYMLIVREEKSYDIGRSTCRY